MAKYKSLKDNNNNSFSKNAALKNFSKEKLKKFNKLIKGHKKLLTAIGNL